MFYEYNIGTRVVTYGVTTGQTNCYWMNTALRRDLNGSLFYNNTAKLPTNMKARVIQKTVNAGWISYSTRYYQYYSTINSINSSNDYVWLLTATEIGLVGDYPNAMGGWLMGDDGTRYPWFDSWEKRSRTYIGGDSWRSSSPDRYDILYTSTGYYDSGWNEPDLICVYGDPETRASSSCVCYSGAIVPCVRVA